MALRREEPIRFLKLLSYNAVLTEIDLHPASSVLYRGLFDEHYDEIERIRRFEQSDQSAGKMSDWPDKDLRTWLVQFALQKTARRIIDKELGLRL